MDSRVEEEISTYEAKNRLSALIDAASRGKRIWITRRGKRVALLSSGVATEAVAGPSLVEAFRSIRNQSRTDGSTLKQLIEEGRK